MSTPAGKNDARLNFRLPGELKRTIEQAAAQLGQSLTDFAVSTLVQNAREVIGLSGATRLSDRDRDVFVRLLDDADSRPNAALVAAANKYKQEAD